MKTYGERLDAALSKSGKDRAQLSQGIGVSVQAIGQVIAGKTKALTAENSARAARFLSVDHYWLATGEGGPDPTSREWCFPGVTLNECAKLSSLDREEVAAIIKMKLQRSQVDTTKKSA